VEPSACANEQRSLAGSDWTALDHTQEAPRAVREYLSTLDEAAWDAAPEVEPKFVSPSDPAARWTGAMRSPAFFANADNYLIDLKAAVIVDVEASQAARQAEVGAARTMLERTAERFGLKLEHLAADSAYGSAEMLFAYLKPILKMGVCGCAVRAGLRMGSRWQRPPRT
jgi:hypothetical protein